MELREIQQTIEEEIAELEKGMYRYESVIRPRFERDKQILEKMRDQHIKIASLIQKDERGEEITEREIREVVPRAFYGEDEEQSKADKMP